ncbi:MAG TPA: DUF1080 domain-containing protein [Verrucomicrobiales bacterium]|jgi:hypothetical protein|nr:DUF1080 domain-containing protein [Verrucomicrobiales bacterium]HCL98106.1 DUF1080 domain-containing protein [Verrucomicrobiales bacterium]
MKKSLFLAISSALIAFAHADHHGKKADGFTSLFDGKTLNGWSQKNGTATYVVKDGTIVGTTKKGSPNSFLCTNKDYGDFELQFDVKVDNKLNSGVQLRSQTKGNTPEGRVNGPQCEIEATDIRNGGEGGYIYGEATGRGWLVANDKRKPHKHFKDGAWNHYRIVCNGARIQTWINGNMVCDLTDEAIFKSHPKGFIGLQVHGVGNRGPFSVAWKNIKIKELK